MNSAIAAAVAGIDLSPYYTAAQTDAAITAPLVPVTLSNAPAWGANPPTWEPLKGANVLRNLHFAGTLSASLQNNTDTLEIDCDSFEKAETYTQARLILGQRGQARRGARQPQGPANPGGAAASPAVGDEPAVRAAAGAAGRQAGRGPGGVPAVRKGSRCCGRRRPAASAQQGAAGQPDRRPSNFGNAALNSEFVLRVLPEKHV